MSKTFHLRFVPFGTGFCRSDGAVRRSSNDPDASALCDNEIVVDVGGRCFGYRSSEPDQPEKSLIFDHHFVGEHNYPSASAAVLCHLTDIADILGPHDPVWIVTHEEPDFDALCATYLVKRSFDGDSVGIDPAVLLDHGIHSKSSRDVHADDGRSLREIDWFNPKVDPSAPAAWAILLAAYASRVDNGKRLYADRSRQLHAVLYTAMSRGRSVREDGLEPLFCEAHRAIASQGRNPIFDPLFDENSKFSPELELLSRELRAYERDLSRARKGIVTLQVADDFESWYPALQRVPLLNSAGQLNQAQRTGPQSVQLREADGIYLRDPECLLFKEWAREDVDNSPMGRGFLFTAVAYTQGSRGGSLIGERYFFALDPEKSHGAHLYNVWAALQAAEVGALLKKGASPQLDLAARRGFEARANALGPYFADPWFDGGNYRATLVVSPYRGSTIPAGKLSDLSDDPIAEIVMRELELSAYLGPVSVKDFSTISHEPSLSGETGKSVARKTVAVEDAVMLGLGHEDYRFAQVELDERSNLANRQLAEQIGRQIWPFLEPAGVRTYPSDFVARHLLMTPSRVLVWNRRGIVVAFKSTGKAEAVFLGTHLGEIARVARDVRAFQHAVRALLNDDRDADAGAVQSRSHQLFDRVINLSLAVAMPEGGPLRRFCEVIRFDGVLAMLRDLSTTVAQHAEGQRDKARNWLLGVVGLIFSLLSALSATTALMKFRLEDAEQGIEAWSNPTHRATAYVVVSALLLVSVAVAAVILIAYIVPARVRGGRKRSG